MGVTVKKKPSLAALKKRPAWWIGRCSDEMRITMPAEDADAPGNGFMWDRIRWSVIQWDYGWVAGYLSLKDVLYSGYEFGGWL